MLGEKKTYKYLEVLEADTIKQIAMKQKKKKNWLKRISEEWEMFSKQISAAGISSKG